MSLPREAFPSCCITQLWLPVAGELIHDCLGVFTGFQIQGYFYYFIREIIQHRGGTV